jgi:photosystem II stability/assembly factor-like uncharacterized protein
MKKIKYLLKAAVILGIVFAFVVPVTALSSNIERLSIKETLINPLTRGGQWIEQASGFWEPSRGINFMDAVNDSIAWAVGYDGSGGQVYETIYTRTVNGGDLWEADIIFGDTGYGLGNICALDGQTAWAAVFSTGVQDENCGIYKTTDGGQNWVHQFEGPYSFANNVWFFDENDGVALGDQDNNYFEIWTTDDGGENWERVPEENFSGHEVVPGEYGWTGVMEAVGDNTIIFGTHAPEGYAFISNDRGHTWFGEFTGCAGTGTNPGVNDLAFKDPMHGLAAHDNGITYDLFKTDDGGVSWQPVTYSGICYASGLSYVPGTANTYISTGGAQSASGASYSIDGGYTWVDYPEVSGTQLLACDFVEGGIGWAGSFNEDEFTGGMYKYVPTEEPDLECSGELVWEDVKAGSTVYGEFNVNNIGTGTLNWEVDTYPTWGTWTFTPENGSLLGGDSVSVNVTVVAPPQKKQEFSGTVKIINSNNPDDFCEIDVALTTPRARSYNLLQNLMERFPNVFILLKYILGV